MPSGIYKRKRKGEYSKCLICGKRFYVVPFQIKKNIGKYCSHKCSAIGTKNGFQNGHRDFVTSEGRKRQAKKQKGKKWKIKDTSKMKGYHSKNEFKKGHIPSKAVRIKISKNNKGKKRSKEFKEKIRQANLGEKSHFWQGGKSFELYGLDWTELLRHSIRTRDCFVCQICKNNGWVVHHIDYDKKNNNPDNLITLCPNCHAKTNFNRDVWRDYFEKEIKPKWKL